MFETEFGGPCLVRKVKWGPWPPGSPVATPLVSQYNDGYKY